MSILRSSGCQALVMSSSRTSFIASATSDAVKARLPGDFTLFARVVHFVGEVAE